MPIFTIELPAEISFTRAGHTVRVDTAALPDSIVAKLVAHGLAQKIGDAAAGKQGKDALATMDAVQQMLQGGDWGRERGTGTGRNKVESLMWTLCMEAARKKLKANGVAWKTIEDETKEKIFADHGEKFRAESERRIEEEKGFDLGDLNL